MNELYLSAIQTIAYITESNSRHGSIELLLPIWKGQYLEITPAYVGIGHHHYLGIIISLGLHCIQCIVHTDLQNQ